MVTALLLCLLAHAVHAQDEAAWMRSLSDARIVLVQTAQKFLDAARWTTQSQLAILQKLGGRPGDFTIGVVGDAEPGLPAWKAVTPKGAFEKHLRQIAAKKPDFILQLGDLVHSGTQKSYSERLVLLENAAGVPIFTTIGNHDRSSPNGSADKNQYQRFLGSLNYFFDHKGWRFISLDTSDRRLTCAGLRWLQQALDTPNRKVIFTHVPPAFLKCKLSADDPKLLPSKEEPPVNASGYFGDVLKAYFDQNADAFGRLAAQAHVERVYLGHIHAYGTGEYLGVKYVLSGGGGSPLYPLPAKCYPQAIIAHHLIVHFGANGVKEEVFSPDGEKLSAD